MNELSGKTAVITGGASGIGLAMAHRFAAAGMRIVLGDVEVGPLDAAVASLADSGASVIGMPCDVSLLDDVRRLETLARETFGNVHVLCNNAGVGSGGQVAEPDDLEMWKWVIDVNLWGVIYGCKVFLSAMIEHGEGGHVVNTASMAGHASAPLMGPYNVSKYGVVALSETLSKEMQMTGTGIGVSVLCPAFVQTAIGSSHRNLPESLRPDGEPAVPSDTQSLVAKLIAAGLPPSQVADAVHDAVVSDTFWILTHDESKPAITERARQIVEGVNPTATGFA
ncbi:MAG: SDR family NAD(P)-dependent oxidoreductase [Ilumatobacter sp.]|jgi:NAD(P)-dependent dehydrogenase (short-subunit alcohol dehydrogenase family)|uniref:SDR family NAD(P)-dependent oxidoreductase n=1 Tax=Ilumatobacter sp. TaxID=1967498 RepID=UPI0039187D48